jgi:RimJ/RimL family protein N-acetyltransferase
MPRAPPSGKDARISQEVTCERSRETICDPAEGNVRPRPELAAVVGEEAKRERLDPAPIRFRPLEVGDLPLMHRWISAPHVLRWWADEPQTEEQVAKKYGVRIGGQEPTRPYVICYGDWAIGYIQSYLLDDYPEYRDVLAVTERAAGIDLFIGEAEFVHRGLGAPLIRRFLREIVFADTGAVSCLIGPSVLNHAAIRTYGRAGFQYVGTVQVPGEAQPEYVMRIAREAVLTEE